MSKGGPHRTDTSMWRDGLRLCYSQCLWYQCFSCSFITHVPLALLFNFKDSNCHITPENTVLFYDCTFQNTNFINYTSYFRQMNLLL